MANIHYTSPQLAAFYAGHRCSWPQFYPSEQHVFERLAITSTTSVIDLGCACGGLGVALAERFGVRQYIGVDINAACIAAAPDICPWGSFHAGDFLDLHAGLPTTADLACSLSAADWNVDTEPLLAALFSHLRPGGHLVFSCRLSNGLGIEPLREVRQRIAFGGGEARASDVETAPYKVFRLDTILRLLTAIGDSDALYAYGYWGKVPSSVEQLGLTELCYTVWSIRKASAGQPAAPPRLTLDVPSDFLL